ncbi:MAG: TetR/AcrR family transcriptional regulator [Ectothiorhodospiraceae bacterium]|nr:TetR/AcrR family transcriptional regulator [Ectothiorhodospiraceae bacterium]MCH8506606.1 TetR/AcrR family transcriptional regulator [Ectothiorhodospiraceae bacterium]
MSAAGFRQFSEEVNAWQPSLLREVFQQHQHQIRVKKEAVAVERLELIFRTALDISNRQGFRAMSVRDLSEATGISMGALYSYIDSKESLLDMILSYGACAAGWAMRVPDSVGSARERLRWILRAHLYLSEVMLPWFFFSYMETRHFSRQFRRQAIGSELWTEHLVADCLRDGNERGEFNVEDPELTAALIKPLLQDWYLKRWKYRQRDIDVERYTSTVLDFVEAYVVRGAVSDASQQHPKEKP